MTNQQNLQNFHFLKAIEDIYYSTKETKIEIPKSVMIFVSGNMRLLKPTNDEHEAMEADFLKVWKKDYKFDDTKAEDKLYLEEANKSFLEFRNSKSVKKQISEWFEKENNIELVKVDNLEGVIMPFADLETFEKIMLK